MRDLSPREMDMVVREFAIALATVRRVETERMRNTLYFLELLRDGVADLLAELREKNAAAVAQKPLTNDYRGENAALSKSLKNFGGAPR
jgi:hypothetical protein